MATENITPKNTLKSWFKRGLKPLEVQFHAWMDSYWHKSEKIPTSSVENLETVLNSKAEEANVTELGKKTSEIEMAYQAEDTKLENRIQEEAERAMGIENEKVDKEEGKELMPSPSPEFDNSYYLTASGEWKRIDPNAKVITMTVAEGGKTFTLAPDELLDYLKAYYGVDDFSQGYTPQHTFPGVEAYFKYAPFGVVNGEDGNVDDVLTVWHYLKVIWKGTEYGTPKLGACELVSSSNSILDMTEYYCTVEVDQSDEEIFLGKVTYSSISRVVVSGNEEIQEWLDQKADVTHTHTKEQILDFPMSLPANGGNADTVDGKHASDFVLNTGIPSIVTEIMRYDDHGSYTDYLCGIGIANDNHHKLNLWVKQFPESLKNPNALIFSGSFSGSYDGSSALNVNIPSLDGYATQSWVQEQRYIRQDQLEKLKVTHTTENEAVLTRSYEFGAFSVNDATVPGSSHLGVILSNTDSNSTLATQLFMDVYANRNCMAVRNRMIDGVWGPWKPLAFKSDIPDLAGGISESQNMYVSSISVSGHTVGGTLRALPVETKTSIVNKLNESGEVTMSQHWVFAAGVANTSDVRFKRNMEPIGCVLDRIVNLSVFKYNWEDESGLLGKRRIGISAQEMEERFPEITDEMEDGRKTKTVDLQGQIAVLFAAVKEVIVELEEMKRENVRLKDKLKYE